VFLINTTSVKFSTFFLCLLLLGGCKTFRSGWVSENSYKVEWNKKDYKEKKTDEITPKDFDGPLGGHFDDEGNWIPDKKSIPPTYKIPDISTGFIVDVSAIKITPCLQIELLEIHTPIPYVGTFKFDVGLAYQRTYVYVGILWTSIFEVSTGGFFGWNFEEREMSYGVGISLIKF